MDFRGVCKSASTRLATPSTAITPQLDNYDLFQDYSDRDSPVTMPSNEEPFMLVFNLASVNESELKITRQMNKSDSQDVLQVEVIHLRKEMIGVPPFTRDCTYRFLLPEDLNNKILIALWTADHHLIVFESSNLTDVQITQKETEEVMDVGIQVENTVTVIQPRKVDHVFKSALNIGILRRSMAVAELGLFNAKRIVQNFSFACPDIDRPDEKDNSTVKKDDKPAVTDATMVCEGFVQQCINKVVAEELRRKK